VTRTLVAVVALAVATTAAGEEQIQRIASRPGVTQSFVLVRPAGPPVASAILIPGGRGRLGLERGRLAAGATNFLVRNRAAFAATVCSSPFSTRRRTASPTDSCASGRGRSTPRTCGRS